MIYCVCNFLGERRRADQQSRSMLGSMLARSQRQRPCQYIYVRVCREAVLVILRGGSNQYRSGAWLSRYQKLAPVVAFNTWIHASLFDRSDLRSTDCSTSQQFAASLQCNIINPYPCVSPWLALWKHILACVGISEHEHFNTDVNRADASPSMGAGELVHLDNLHFD